ncbi:MAG: US12 family protein [Bacteroidales bacterium]|nr:US12 family protein [Bacteroidales bacterium]
MANSSITTYLGDRKRERLESGLADTMGVRAYNTVMCAVLLYGFIANALVVYFFAEPLAALLSGARWWMLLLGYLVPTFAGIFITSTSKNPLVSFLGYNLVVLPIGVMLALLLPMVPAGMVVKAMSLTGMVTLTMMVLANLAPQFFLGMWRMLFVGLLVGLVAEIVASFLLGYRGGLFDWLFVLIFSGYIGYDLAKSQVYPKTPGNAISCALDLYLDVINIFIRILSILSRR